MLLAAKGTQHQYFARSIKHAALLYRTRFQTRGVAILLAVKGKQHQYFERS